MSEPQTVRAQDGREDRLMDHPEGRHRKRTRADIDPPRTSVRNSDSRPATAEIFSGGKLESKESDWNPAAAFRVP